MCGFYSHLCAEVPLTTAMKFSDSSNSPYFEVSAKLGKNVSVVIEDLIKQIIRFRKQREVMNVSKSTKSGNSTPTNQKKSFFRSRRDMEDDDVYQSNA